MTKKNKRNSKVNTIYVGLNISPQLVAEQNRNLSLKTKNKIRVSSYHFYFKNKKINVSTVNNIKGIEKVLYHLKKFIEKNKPYLQRYVYY